MGGSASPPLENVLVRVESLVALQGDLGVPDGARGVVLFAHGSGSGRRSPRNRAVAQVLRGSGLATLLLDLKTELEQSEDTTAGRLRIDIELLAERLLGAADWLAREERTRDLSLGLYGASTGAGAALAAAASSPERIAAVVSRGGRPDLAGAALPRVRAPSLLLVGELDPVVLGLNEEALERLGAREKELRVVPGATHLFVENGTLEAVARHAADWFTRHLGARSP